MELTFKTDYKTDFYFLFLFGSLVYFGNWYLGDGVIGIFILYFWIALIYTLGRFILSSQSSANLPDDYEYLFSFEEDSLHYTNDGRTEVFDYNDIAKITICNLSDFSYVTLLSDEGKSLVNISVIDHPKYKIPFRDLQSLKSYFIEKSNEGSNFVVEDKIDQFSDNIIGKVLSKKLVNWLKPYLFRITVFFSKTAGLWLRTISDVDDRHKEFNKSGICPFCKGNNEPDVYICKWCNNRQVDIIDGSFSYMYHNNLWIFWIYFVAALGLFFAHDSLFYTITIALFGLLIFIRKSCESALLPINEIAENIVKLKNVKRNRRNRFKYVGILLLFILFYSKPDEADFKDFAAENLSEQVSDNVIIRKLSDLGLGSVFSKLPSESIYKFKDFLFITVVHFDIKKVDSESDNVILIGILDTFIPLRSPI